MVKLERRVSSIAERSECGDVEGTSRAREMSGRQEAGVRCYLCTDHGKLRRIVDDGNDAQGDVFPE